MEVRGCKKCGSTICITASAGGGVTALGVLAPIPYMIWNTLVQCLCSFCVCPMACLSGNGCLCGVVGGTFCSDLLLPVWCCAAPHCACGSCASLGTVWMQIITFAGFGGAAWYVGLADVLIIVGMVACMMALVLWGIMCFGEQDNTKATSEEQESMITADSTEDKPPPTGAMKF